MGADGNESSAWRALMAQLAGTEQGLGQPNAGALVGGLGAENDRSLLTTNQNGSGGTMQALFKALAERLRTGDREPLLADREASLPMDQADALVAEWGQSLSVEDQTALITELAGRLPADERQALLAALTENRPVGTLSERIDALKEQRAQIAELTARLSPDGRDELLGALIEGTAPEQQAGTLVEFASAVSDALSPEAQNALLEQAAALFGQGSFGQNGNARSASGLPLDPSNLRDQLREWLGNEQRAGQPLALNSAQRGALTADALRSFIESGSIQQAGNDALPAGFREALASMVAGRERGSDARHEGPRGESLTLASGMLSGASAGSSTTLGLGGATTAAAGITAPLHSPAWPQQLGQQLVMLNHRGGEQKVEIRLNPPELGPLTVSLKVMEQNTQIQFLAANAQVRAAVEQAIPQLREALAEQGIQLGETSVGEQSQQAGQESTGAGSHGGSPDVATGDVTDELLVDADALGATAVQLDGRVDLYA